MRRTDGVGRYADGEADLTIVASTYSGGGPLVIVCHGAGGSASTYKPAAQRRDLDYLANTGCVVVCPDLAGVSPWANDDFLAEVDNVRNWAAAEYDADLTRLALIGRSMGGMGALNYAWRNPALVRCAALQAPVVAADALHDRDPGLGALMDDAYDDQWETAKTSRDPSATTPAGLIAAVADKYRIWYSTNDPTVLPSDIESFVALTGVQAIPLGAVGHSDTTIAAAVQAESQAAWIWSQLAA